jgi:hypothetical protein
VSPGRPRTTGRGAREGVPDRLTCTGHHVHLGLVVRCELTIDHPLPHATEVGPELVSWDHDMSLHAAEAEARRLETRAAGRRGGVSGLSAATARIVRGRVMTSLTAASSIVVNAVERLCDHDLGEAEREYSTDQLYAAVADVRLALAELAEVVGASEHAGDGADVVVRISRSRFRRRGGGRGAWR